MRNELAARLEAAAGRRPASLVLKGAEVLNVFSDRFVQADIAIEDGQIVGIGSYHGVTEVDLTGKYVVPGFIDTHLHLESTMVTPRQLVGEVVPWGTTTLVADPHEIANVCGLAGIRYLQEQTEGLPCNIYFMLPSCVPATSWEDSGARLSAADLQELASHPRVLGLGEVMDYVGVVNGNDVLLEKLSAFTDKICDGHAPFLSGKELQAYRAAGIRTEHECSTAEEAVEKISAGFALLVREGSAAKNLTALMTAALTERLPFSRFAFCTDDKHIEDIRRNGHIRENIAKAIELGIPVVEAYKMASYYGAQIYGLRTLGAVAAGYQADLVVLDDPALVRIHSVYHQGRLAASGKSPLSCVDRIAPASLLDTVHVAPLGEEALALRCGDAPFPVIELMAGQLTTRRRDAVLPNQDGYFIPNREFAKIAVIERHRATGKLGLGVVSGFCLHGAMATTVGHDSHNLLVVGDCDADMLLAVDELIRQGGGYLQVGQGKVLGRLPLPICGLLTDRPVDEVQHTLSQMTQTARQMGVPECYDPFITMSFLALPVIPALRITDRGLFDSCEMQFI